MACHTRSNSLPSRSHSYVLKAEEELNQLRAGVASPCLTYEIMLDALKAVGQVYESINGLLCMSTNTSGLSHSEHKRWVDQELEESIKMLDMCSTSRDSLDQIKCYVQDFESAIRRGEIMTMKSRVSAYIQLVKKANKDVKKNISRKSKSMAGSSAVVLVLSEARDIVASLLQSVFSFLLKQSMSEKNVKWSLVSSLVLKKTNVGKDMQEEDISSLRENVEGLENGLESLFKHLIQCRVSLLNICSV
ncbi:hypothetical protein LUZ63_009713 [Rhynchospora breviuscula]|uniref:Uncharacterized protein n=1 Tax=Rhynchospora breviuscula TaxID=2022672 RepID=A0A9Q0HPD7_9POAL|nr:hypothetical protein LUZ63_009713 [Rhynchospora breviuscula]